MGRGISLPQPHPHASVRGTDTQRGRENRLATLSRHPPQDPHASAGRGTQIANAQRSELAASILSAPRMKRQNDPSGARLRQGEWKMRHDPGRMRHDHGRTRQDHTGMRRDHDQMYQGDGRMREGQRRLRVPHESTSPRRIEDWYSSAVRKEALESMKDLSYNFSDTEREPHKPFAWADFRSVVDQLPDEHWAIPFVEGVVHNLEANPAVQGNDKERILTNLLQTLSDLSTEDGKFQDAEA